jgi:hypothetical protein
LIILGEIPEEFIIVLEESMKNLTIFKKFKHNFIKKGRLKKSQIPGNFFSFRDSRKLSQIPGGSRNSRRYGSPGLKCLKDDITVKLASFKKKEENPLKSLSITI